MAEKNMSTPSLSTDWEIQKKHETLWSGGNIYINSKEDTLYTLADYQIKVINRLDGSIQRSISHENEEIICFAIHPNERSLASVTRNMLIRIFNLQTGVSIKSFKCDNSLGISLCYDPSGDLIAMGSTDKTVKVYQLSKNRQLNTLKGHKGSVLKVEFHPEVNKYKLFSSSEDGRICIWDIILGECEGILEGHKSSIPTFTFTKDCKTLISGDRSGRIIFWDVEKKCKINHVTTNESIECIEYALWNKGENKSPLLITMGEDGIARIVNINNKSICFNEPNPYKQSFIRMAVCSPRHRGSGEGMLILGGTIDQNIIFYRLQMGDEQVALRREGALMGYKDEITDLRVVAGHSYARCVLATNSNLLKIVDLDTWLTQMIPGHTDIIMSLDVKREYILSGGKDNQIRLWKFIEGGMDVSCIAIFKGHNKSIIGCEFGGDNMQYFASAGQDNCLKIWNIQSLIAKSENNKNKSKKGTIEITKAWKSTGMTHSKEMNVMRISPNGKLIATGSHDRSIKVWKASTLYLELHLKGHTRGVWDLSFSPIDKVLASASSDKTIKIWNLTDGGCLRTLQGHNQSVLRVIWINSALQLVSGGADGMIKIWNVGGECIRSYGEHTGKIWGLDITDKGELVSGCSDSLLAVWKDTTEIVRKEKEEMNSSKIEEWGELNNLVFTGSKVPAAVLAFKLRDYTMFFTLVGDIIRDKEDGKRDPVDQYLEDKAEFDSQFSATGNSGNSGNIYNYTYTFPQISGIVKEIYSKEKIRLLEVIRDYNSNSRYSFPAHVLLFSLLSFLRRTNSLSLMLQQGTQDGFSTYHKPGKSRTNVHDPNVDNMNFEGLIDVLISYSQRHFNRTAKLIQKSYILDLIATKMNLFSGDGAMVGTLGTVGRKRDRTQIKGKTKMVKRFKRSEE